MACKVDIKAKLENQIETLTNDVMNKDLFIANKVAKRINKQFGATMVTFKQRTPDTFDRNITVPNIVVDKYFNAQLEMESQEARAIQQQDAQRAGEEDIDDTYMFQLDSSDKTPSKAMYDSKLREAMISFLQGLNIKVDIDRNSALKELNFEYGDPTSAFDVLQKYLLIEQNITNKELALQTANALYTFLGKKSKLSIELWGNIKTWEKYDEVYNRFIGSREEQSEDIETRGGSLDSFAHKQAIIHFIAEVIEKGVSDGIVINKEGNPDINKEYFDSKGYKNKYADNVLERLYNNIWNWIQENVFNNVVIIRNNRERLNNIVLDIVDDVYKKDYKKWIREYAENDQGQVVSKDGNLLEQKFYEETLNKDPYAKTIIEKLFGVPFMNYKLSGSQVVRKYGKLFRSVTESLHDIDGVIPLETFIKEGNSFEFRGWLKTRGLQLMKGRNQKKFLKEMMPFLEAQSWYKNFKYSFPTWELTSAFIGRDHKNAESVTITGTVTHPTEIDPQTGKNKLYILDFFLRVDEGNYPEIYDNYWKDWKQIFEAKVNMGRSKDLNDLIYFEPFTSDKYKFTNKGFRYFTFAENSKVGINNQLDNPTQAQASPETVSKVKQLLDKMGVSMQTLSEYAKNHPTINMKSVNAISDSVNKIIAIAEGKEAGAITEEMVHIATAIINQKDPNLITRLISQIGNFEIYKQTYEKYKNNPFYKTPDGKPNIRLIKKEAVDKLIAEIIIRDGGGVVNDPKMLEESNQLMVKNWWIKILDWFKSFHKESGISLFEEVAESILDGSAIDGDTAIEDGHVMFQLSDKQKDIQRRILETKNYLRKRTEEVPKGVNPLMNDDTETDNYYEVKKENGEWVRNDNRVTNRTKSYYDRLFPNKNFTEREKLINEYKREKGIEGHNQFENIHARYFDELTGEKREVPLPRPTINSPISNEIYGRLEEYFLDMIDKMSEGGTKNILVFSEAMIYDSKQKEAGTIDILIVDENGKGHIIDWKFMDAFGDDVPWYKKGAFNIQLKRYKEILRDNYGIKEFGMNRAVPILFQFKKEKPWIADSRFIVSGINIGNINSDGIEDIKLIPVSEQEETTGNENLDRFIKRLNSIMEKISQERVGTEEESDFKNERLNIIERAIRIIRGTLDISPAVELIQTLRREGDNLLMDYEQEFEKLSADSKDLDNSRISEFAEDMRQYLATTNALSDVDTLLEKLIYSKEMEHDNMTQEEIDEIAERKEVLAEFTQEVSAIRQSRYDVEEASKKFADKFIGQRNQVAGLLNPEAIVQGLSSYFRGVSELGTAALRILYKSTTNAKARAMREATEEVDELLDIRERIVKKGGNIRNYLKKIYQKDSKGNFMNKLVLRYDKKFYEGVKENAKEGNHSRKWIMENIDLTKYNAEASRVLNKKIQRYRHRYGDNVELMEKLIESEINKWDFTKPTFNGWSNYLLYRFPLDKWESAEYKEVKADKDLLDLYNFINNLNQEAAEMGYITNQMRSSFLPFVRKSMAESLSWDMDISAIVNMAGQLKVRPDDIGYGQINALTGEAEYSVPKYYTHDFSRQEDGSIDTSEVSEDLFKNLILYLNHSKRYKFLTEIEGQINLVKTVETFKSHYKTGRFGDLVMEGGEAQTEAGNYDNAKLFEQFQRTLLYGHKEVLSQGDTPLGIGKITNYMKRAISNVTGKKYVEDNESVTSLVKTMDVLNKVFQIKTLGFEIISGAANMFGGNMQLLAQSGRYFKPSEAIKNEMRLVGNKFTTEADREATSQMFDLFMPMKDDPTYDRLLEAGLTAGTRHNFSDWLFVFMRQPEILLEKSIFVTLLQNMMVVDGKIVSIRKHVKDKYKGRYATANQLKNVEKTIENEIAELKKTQSIESTRKLDENGKLVIPGLDTSNTTEIQRLTDLTRRLSRAATGGMSDGDINKMSMNIWTRSMMVFKNWIPKLADTRFSEFRKTSDDFSTQIDENGMSIGDTYDIGRLRLFSIVMGMAIRDRALHISNIIQGNEQGIKALDEMYEEFAEKYKKRTGEQLTMTKEDFYDMIRMNLQNQVNELILLLSLFGGAIAMGIYAPDDDDALADKNFYRFSERVVDKFIGELSFFYNPLEFQRMLSGSAFPAIGLFSDIQRFTNHFFMETSGIDLSNTDLTAEEVRKKAQPIKNAARIIPVAKSLITYAALFDSEFAKEFDITIQNNNFR